MPNSRSNPFRLPPMSSQDSLGTWRFMRLWRGRSMCLVGNENSKFTRFSVSISVTAGDAIGNFSAAKLKEAKHSMVAKCKILVEKGKEVIGVDTKTESNGRYENLSAKEARGDELKVASGEKVWGYEMQCDLENVHVYKKLLEDVGKRSGTLQSLNLRLICMRSAWTIIYNLVQPKKELVKEEEVSQEPFVALTSEEEDEVEDLGYPREF
ncbi:hypothetical protein JHK86_016380 [Glycine max]|nr:hypothetical protein JHK86_016380 [Glycine max]